MTSSIRRRSGALSHRQRHPRSNCSDLTGITATSGGRWSSSCPTPPVQVSSSGNHDGQMLGQKCGSHAFAGPGELRSTFRDRSGNSIIVLPGSGTREAPRAGCRLAIAFVAGPPPPSQRRCWQHNNWWSSQDRTTSPTRCRPAEGDSGQGSGVCRRQRRVRLPVEPRAATIPQRGTDSGRDIVIDVTLTCSTTEPRWCRSTPAPAAPSVIRTGHAGPLCSISRHERFAAAGAHRAHRRARQRRSRNPALTRLDRAPRRLLPGQWPDGTPTVG